MDNALSMRELEAAGVTMPVLGIMAFDQEQRLKTLEALAPS